MKLVKTGYLYPSNSRVSETDSISRTFTEVQSAIPVVGSAIINPDYGTFLKASSKFCTKRKGSVGRRKAVLIESFTISRKVPVKAGAIPAGDDGQSS
jgi:hypothetical protein